MARYTRPTVPAHWTVAEVARVKGASLTPGRQLRITGERGTFVFLRHVTNTAHGHRVARRPRQQRRAASVPGGACPGRQAGPPGALHARRGAHGRPDGGGGMTGRPCGAFTARGVYRVAGHDGPWHYVGPATFVDDEGRTVEHDWVRMVQDDAEVWVDPADVEAFDVRPMPLHLIADDPQDHRAA
jgi:hypothetical protein